MFLTKYQPFNCVFRVMSDKLLLQNKNRPGTEDEIAMPGNSIYELQVTMSQNSG